MNEPIMPTKPTIDSQMCQIRAKHDQAKGADEYAGGGDFFGMWISSYLAGRL